MSTILASQEEIREQSSSRFGIRLRAFKYKTLILELTAAKIGDVTAATPPMGELTAATFLLLLPARSYGRVSITESESAS